MVVDGINTIKCEQNIRVDQLKESAGLYIIYLVPAACASVQYVAASGQIVSEVSQQFPDNAHILVTGSGLSGGDCDLYRLQSDAVFRQCIVILDGGDAAVFRHNCADFHFIDCCHDAAPGLP
jgi:hypothetical protein